MSQTIKIKRSTGNGKPTSVAQGELFYAYGTGGTFGKRLALGNVAGGGNTPEIIGGAFFTDMLDHTAGTLTASSAIIVDSGSAIDGLRVSNQGELKLFEATSNGAHYTAIKAAASITASNTYTLPAAPVNGRFLTTNAGGDLSWAAISSILTIGGDSGGNDNVTVGTDTFNIIGTANEVETSVSNNTITVGLPANVTISGNLTVSGTTTTVSSTTVNVADSMLSLATGNGTQDVIDIGFYGLYDTSGSQDLYSGFFRDANDSGKWKLFKDNQAAPTTTVNTSGTGYAVATLVANLESAAVAITGGSITGITDLAVADGGTGLSAVAKGSVLVANSANTLTAVDGGGSTDKMLLYTASSDTISWSNAIDGGTYS
jgi:hypothetical protein